MLALTRAVSPALDRCQLSYLPRTSLETGRAARQHAGYETVLEELGCRILRVPPADHLPDSVFVEDTAVVVDEAAIMTRPGAASRRSEVDAVADVLGAHRPIHWIQAPGTLDGGDVLRIGRSVWVGRSERTNRAGVQQLRSVLESFGYRVTEVAVEWCLHLKSAVTALSDRALVVNPKWVDPARFSGYEVIPVDPAEPHAANVLRVGDAVVMPADYPRTRERIAAVGIGVVTVDVSELLKAEGGVTCCSILLADGF